MQVPEPRAVNGIPIYEIGSVGLIINGTIQQAVDKKFRLHTVLRSALRQVGHAHTMVTSPPYYGAGRDYGEETITITPSPHKEPCDISGQEHEWVPLNVPQTSNCTRGSNNKKLWAKMEEQKPPPPSYYCKKCEAYKGMLGQEENPAIYAATLSRLVDDTTYSYMDESPTLWVNIGDSRHDKGQKRGSLTGAPETFVRMMSSREFLHRSTNIWFNYTFPDPQNSRPEDLFEYVYMFSRDMRYYYDKEAVMEKKISGPGYKPIGNVWLIQTEQGVVKGHSAPMPSKLAERCILLSTQSGDTVLDPFAGSLTTAVAALRHGRRFIVVEPNPEYVEIGLQRLQGISMPMF